MDGALGPTLVQRLLKACVVVETDRHHMARHSLRQSTVSTNRVLPIAAGPAMAARCAACERVYLPRHVEVSLCIVRRPVLTCIATVGEVGMRELGCAAKRLLGKLADTWRCMLCAASQQGRVACACASTPSRNGASSSSLEASAARWQWARYQYLGTVEL